MIKRMIVMLLLVGLVLGGVFGYKQFGSMMMMKAMASASNPAQTVTTTKANGSAWQDEIKAVGTFKAVKGTNVSSEAAGMVENIFVESGQDIEGGTLLVQLKSDEDQAQLNALESKLKLAQITLDRDDKQIKAKAISQATYDADKADFENLKAQVEQQKAALEKKTVLAPFAGRLGIRQVDQGQYLAAGTAMFALQQLDPIYIDFAVPQQDMSKLQVGQKIAISTDVAPGKPFEGEISALDATVDESTRNINVRATVKNPDKALLPGMFASVSIEVGQPIPYLTLPQTAITYNPYGNVVFITQKVTDPKPDAPAIEAHMVFVKTGLTRGDQVAILSGISEGDEVITSGQMKLRNGTPLVINNEVQPKNDQDPHPKDE